MKIYVEKEEICQNSELDPITLAFNENLGPSLYMYLRNILVVIVIAGWI